MLLRYFGNSILLNQESKEKLPFLSKKMGVQEGCKASLNLFSLSTINSPLQMMKVKAQRILIILPEQVRADPFMALGMTPC